MQEEKIHHFSDVQNSHTRGIGSNKYRRKRSTTSLTSRTHTQGVLARINAGGKDPPLLCYGYPVSHITSFVSFSCWGTQWSPWLYGCHGYDGTWYVTSQSGLNSYGLWLSHTWVYMVTRLSMLRYSLWMFIAQCSFSITLGWTVRDLSSARGIEIVSFPEQ